MRFVEPGIGGVPNGLRDGMLQKLQSGAARFAIAIRCHDNARPPDADLPHQMRVEFGQPVPIDGLIPDRRRCRARQIDARLPQWELPRECRPLDAQRRESFLHSVGQRRRRSGGCVSTSRRLINSTTLRYPSAADARANISSGTSCGSLKMPISATRSAPAPLPMPRSSAIVGRFDRSQTHRRTNREDRR